LGKEKTPKKKGGMDREGESTEEGKENTTSHTYFSVILKEKKRIKYQGGKTNCAAGVGEKKGG